MLWFMKSKTTSRNQNAEGSAKVRVGDRGGVFIPSSEIASLPEVQRMQELASVIVSRNASTPRKG